MLIKLVNTRNFNNKSLIKNAIINPVNNKGLWSFLHINKVSKEFMKELPKLEFKEISYEISKCYNLDGELGDEKLKQIIDKSFNFPIINKKINNNLSICELYHGKSKSFKDIGTSFTANIIEELNNDKLNIVTATTGDTGAAVASAFYNKKNIKVHILYPKNKISIYQRKQITTMGKNIYCYEVDSNFDECQDIVKKLLNDKDLKNITTINSVNIGRIIGQIFYYFYMCKEHLDKKINISIPTGNLGNGLSCYISKKMGLPINDIILACNYNSNLNKLLNYNNPKNKFGTKSLSNAIDIINPSNLERLHCLINNYKDTKLILDYLLTTQTNDDEIINTINCLYYNTGIIIDPHTAVAYDGLMNKYKNLDIYNNNYQNIILSTANPIKFINEINYENMNIDNSSYNEFLGKEEFIKKCDNNYDQIKNYIK